MSDNWPSKKGKEACSREELNVHSSEMKSTGDWGGRRGALQQPKHYFNVCSISPPKNSGNLSFDGFIWTGHLYTLSFTAILHDK